MIRVIALSILYSILTISCASQQATESKKEPLEKVSITPGTYKASVNAANIADDVKAFHVTSEISFGFEPDQTFIYKVAAMGRTIEDVGRWEIRGDSLHIFSLQKGPDSAFKVVKVGDGNYEIKGPNHFILTKEEVITPIKQ